MALRLKGLTVTVFERSSDIRKVQVGGGFHVWTNAMRALNEIGLGETARELGSPLERTRFLNHHGKLLAEWPCGAIGRELEAQDVGLSRAALQGMLVEGVSDGDVRTGMECTGFEQDADGVTARFSNGQEERGDVLVAADGLRSTVRGQLFGPTEPDFAGYTQWQTTTERGADLIPAGDEHVIFGPALRGVMHHVDEGLLFWAAVTYGPEGGGAVAEAPKATLLERFADFPDALQAAIDATPEENFSGLDIYDRKPLDRWGDGRVTMLGDAAHPMTTNTSQGGNQALEDAVVLAGCLGEASDHATALREYEARRIPRTSSAVKRSHMAAKTNAWNDPVRCRARDLITTVVFRTVALKDHRKFVAAEL